MKNISKLEKIINFTFKDKNLLITALRHSSSLKKDAQKINNERLEFLGDRVLGLVIANMLYNYFPNEEEGDLSQRLSVLVSKESLYQVGERIMLKEFIKTIEKKPSISIVSDACESLIGAVFLDGGLKSIEKIINVFWTPLIEDNLKPPKHIKNILQEWAAEKKLNIPSYDIVSSVGPDHSPFFTVSVSLEGFNLVTGVGKTKREAEQIAAINFMEINDVKI